MERSAPVSLATLLGAALLGLAFSSALAQTTAPRGEVAAPQKYKPATPAKTSAGDPSAKPEPLPPWQILTAGAAAHNPVHRAQAVAALGTLRPSHRVVALMQHALADKDPSIRQLAATTLGEMRARTAIPSLKLALADDSPEVSFAAAKSLWAMGDRTGRDVFIQILSGEKSSSPGLLKGELQATKRKFHDPGKLAIIGAKEAASSLFGPAGWGIKVMEEVMQDRSASARAMSAILLGPDATLDELHQLQDALNDKNWIVRAAAAQALGTSRHRDQIPYLRSLLQDDKPAVRYMAAASILRLSTGAAGAAVNPPNALKSDARPAFAPRDPNSFNEDLR